jgi:hypothetical protein
MLNEIVPSSPSPLVQAEAEAANHAYGRCQEIVRVHGEACVAYGNEVWLRNKSGQWCVQTGYVKQRLLEWYRADPGRTGLWGALMIHAAADPTNSGETPYFRKELKANPNGVEKWGRWEEYVCEPREVLFRGGIYDLATRTFKPWDEKEIVFGPLVDADFDPGIMEACRQSDFTHAPAKFRELVGMVGYALSDKGAADPGTVRFFLQTVAQVLRPHAGYGHFVHVLGESGARKTTILRALLGAPYGCRGLSETWESRLAEDKFASIDLLHKVANLSNDSAASAKFPSFIKQVTSGYLIVEKKFCDAQKVALTAKLYATMNHPQNLKDSSRAIENRLTIFRFHPRTDNHRGAEGAQWMKADFWDAQDRLWITHWLLAALEAAGVQVPAPTPRAAAWKEETLNRAMPLRAFVEEELDLNAEKPDLKTHIVNHAIETEACTADGADAFKKSLGEYLGDRHGIRSKQVRNAEGLQVRVWVGVGVKKEKTVTGVTGGPPISTL